MLIKNKQERQGRRDYFLLTFLCSVCRQLISFWWGLSIKSCAITQHHKSLHFAIMSPKIRCKMTTGLFFLYDWEESFSGVESCFTTRHVWVSQWYTAPHTILHYCGHQIHCHRVNVQLFSVYMSMWLIRLYEGKTFCSIIGEKVKPCLHILAGWRSRSEHSHSCLWFVLHPHSPDPRGLLCPPSAARSPSSTWWVWLQVLWLYI